METKTSENDTEFRNEKKIIGKVAYNYSKIISVFYKTKMHLTSAKRSSNSVLSISIINSKWTREKKTFNFLYTVILLKICLIQLFG